MPETAAGEGFFRSDRQGCAMIGEFLFLPGYTVFRINGDSVTHSLLIPSPSPFIASQSSDRCQPSRSALIRIITPDIQPGTNTPGISRSRNSCAPACLTSSTGLWVLPCRGHPAISHQGRASGPASSSCAPRPALLQALYPGNTRPGPGRRHRSGLSMPRTPRRSAPGSAAARESGSSRA